MCTFLTHLKKSRLDLTMSVTEQTVSIYSIGKAAVCCGLVTAQFVVYMITTSDLLEPENYAYLALLKADPLDLFAEIDMRPYHSPARNLYHSHISRSN